MTPLLKILWYYFTDISPSPTCMKQRNKPKTTWRSNLNGSEKHKNSATKSNLRLNYTQQITSKRLHSSNCQNLLSFVPFVGCWKKNMEIRIWSCGKSATSCVWKQSDHSWSQCLCQWFPPSLSMERSAKLDEDDDRLVQLSTSLVEQQIGGRS